MNHKRGPIQDRFALKWTPEPFSGCWLWTGEADGVGYGRIFSKKKGDKAHRVSWELHRGEIPPGVKVCHRCDTPGCVNPDHLFLGTQGDNVRDALRKGRMPRKGERCPTSKLTNAQVAIIRNCTESLTALGLRFGVRRQTINAVRQRTTWTHLP